MKKQISSILFPLIAGILLYAGLSISSPNQAHAKTCYGPANPHIAAADLHYTSFWSNPWNQSRANALTDRYGMKGRHWDNGWGWYAGNDVSLPVNRFVNALALLTVSGRPVDILNPPSRQTNNGSDWARWFLGAWRWGAKKIGTPKPDCGKDANATAKTAISVTKFWTPHFFFNSNVLDRANGIVHEARHHEGYGHNAPDSSCDREASCDSHWEYGGANTVQAMYNYTFHMSAENATMPMRRYARTDMVYLLEESFDNRPNWWNQVFWCVEPQYQSTVSGIVSCY